MNFFSNSGTASSSKMPRSTIIPRRDSNCSFTIARSAETLCLSCCLRFGAWILIECLPGDYLTGFAIFFARCGHHVGGQRGARRELIPANPLEIIAHVLLVEGRLRSSRRIGICRPETRGVRRQRFVNPDELFAQHSKFEC